MEQQRDYLLTGTFDDDQKHEIQAGLGQGLDVSFYARPEFLAIQMRQIRMGLEEKLDVSVYNKPEYDWFQMEELRTGLREGLNYSIYADPAIDYQKMRQLRKGLQSGLDLSPYVKLDSGILEELREALLSKIEITEYIKKGYVKEQLKEIRLALTKNLDIASHINIEHRGVAIREIALGLEKGLPVSRYSDIEYGWQQMREIRLGLEHQVEIEEYSNNLYSWQQMQEIRLGLEAGIDVGSYRSLMYTASDMKKMREKIFAEQLGNILAEGYSSAEDEKIAIFISNDEMEACIEVRYDQKVNLNVQRIMDRLKNRGVCQGILKDEIEALVKEKKYNQTIVIAKGRAPKQGEDGWYEFYFNTKPDKTPKILPDGSADFTDIYRFEMVKLGDTVAYYHEPTAGTSGYTVKGRFLKSLRGKQQRILSGKGFKISEDGKSYIAALDGKIELIGERRIEISRMLELSEVNLTSGHINFDGGIHVKGNVAMGSVITATENVIVDGYVEAATIRSGQDILIRRGANGGGFGLLDARGKVLGQFFESIRVVADDDIVGQYSMNAELYAGGMIYMQERKGMLVGGYAKAIKGIQAYIIGNKVGLKTRLSVGIDDAQLTRKEQLEAAIENINKEMKILTHSYEDFKNRYAPEVRNTMEMFLKIENAIYTKELQMKSIVEEKSKLEEAMREVATAKVVAGGILYEGTEITINKIKFKSFTVRDVNVRFRNNQVVAEAN